MKRSEINKALKELEKMIADHQYYLPKFANFTPEEWKTKGHEFDEIRDNMLGWDITDYGIEPVERAKALFWLKMSFTPTMISPRLFLKTFLPIQALHSR